MDERPTMVEWHYELNRTLSLLLTCQQEDCRSSYIVNQRVTCPFCNIPHEKTEYIRLRYWGYDQDPFNGGTTLVYDFRARHF